MMQDMGQMFSTKTNMARNTEGVENMNLLLKD